MTRILLCGLCPLPFENTLRSFGPGIRTWQMALPLARAGHEVHVRAMRIPGAYEEGAGGSDLETVEGIRIERLDQAAFDDPDALRGRIDELAPDALVGATVYGSHALARLSPTLPFWADQFGHVMAEAQAKARLEKADWPLDHFWSLIEPVLRTADRVSTVSERQRWAAVGELGAVGRLGWRNCGVELTATMPCALVPPRSAEIGPVLRGSRIPHDAFVALWSGGYNVWSDVETLFQALELAMDRRPELHFVSTGGEIGGHDEKTYRGFEKLVAASGHRARFHLQGWVEADLVPSYQAEADLGVLTEKVMYEGQLGSKNRIVQWLGGGLPVLYNRVGDLGDLLADEGLGLTFEVGDAEAMAERLVWAAENRPALARLAEAARDYASRELTFEATSRELVAWGARPLRAPDRQARIDLLEQEQLAAEPPSITAPSEHAPPAARPSAPSEHGPGSGAVPHLAEPNPVSAVRRRSSRWLGRLARKIAG